jgi:Ran GTPase-activating protein (RanGAP) involved in mRNA processing and transport
MILRDLEWTVSDNFGLLQSPFEIVCRIDKISDNRWEMRYAADAFASIEFEGNNIDEAMEYIDNRINKLTEMPDQFPVNNDYVFKGFDWIELAEYLNINYQELDEVESVEVITNYITKFKDEMYPVMRRFLEALIKCSEEIDNYTPVWKGLFQIEDQFTFNQLFLTNLRGMWT